MTHSGQMKHRSNDGHAKVSDRSKACPAVVIEERCNTEILLDDVALFGEGFIAGSMPSQHYYRNELCQAAALGSGLLGLPFRNALCLSERTIILRNSSAV